MSAESLRDRLRKMQSVGATILSNATYALAEVDAIEAGTPAPVDPEPDPEPSPQPARGLGVPAGTALAARPAGWHRTATGAVIDGALIDGDATFPDGDLTVRRSRMTGKTAFRGDRLLIEDAELGGLYLSGASDVVARRFITDGLLGPSDSDGIHITSDTGRCTNVLLEHFHVRNPHTTDTSHYDGAQIRGVDNLIMRDGTIDLGPHRKQFTAAMFLQDANGGNADVLLERLTLLGGGYTCYLNADRLRIRDCIIDAGEYGLLYPGGGAGIVEFEGNRDLDGNALTLVDGRIVRG